MNGTAMGIIAMNNANMAMLNSNNGVHVGFPEPVAWVVGVIIFYMAYFVIYMLILEITGCRDYDDFGLTWKIFFLPLMLPAFLIRALNK